MKTVKKILYYFRKNTVFNSKLFFFILDVLHIMKNELENFCDYSQNT